ncbi:MAG: protein kinase [Bryobacteraceae bacterium]|nr:protein kinase [Bryobacteraceae bacterium]
MSPERWQQIESLFYRALEVPRQEVDEFLIRESGDDSGLLAEVRSLLSAEEGASKVIESRVRDAVLRVGDESASTSRRVGPYRLVERLGRGGMGSVYLATRDDEEFQKQVAIKLVRPGADNAVVLARFRRERQILARLEHPNIARLLDGGTTAEGLPYIVMEFVDGLRINEYCHRERLPLRRRLELFLQVCSAVEYAHAHFIVHRDIKPGNILVDKGGVPRLLDFGISKVLAPTAADDPNTVLTQGFQLCTPDYASPEQVRTEAVGPPSDIFSLGVVLYELVTGQLPHKVEDYTPRGLEQAICLQTPAAPSTVAPVPADVDAIVMRALEKRPQDRYPSVTRLADDIRRYLALQPIWARTHSPNYLLGLFVRRNALAVAAGLALFAALAASVIVISRQWAAARASELQVRRLANSLVTDVYEAIRDLPGAAKARQRLLETSVVYLDQVAQQKSNDPEVQRDLALAWQRTGELQGYVLGSNLGQSQKALESYRRALGHLDQSLRLKPDQPEAQLARIDLLRHVGDILSYNNSSKEAMEAFSRAFRLADEWKAQHPIDSAWRSELGELAIAASRVSRNLNDNPGALKYATEALELYREMAADSGNPRDVRRSLANALSAYGMALARLGQRPAADKSYREAVSILESVNREGRQDMVDQRNLMLAYSHVGDLARDEGRLQEAREAFTRMAALAESLRKADTADQRALADHGIALMRLAQVTEGPRKLEIFGQSKAALEGALRTNPKNMQALTNLSNVEDRMGDARLAAGDVAAARQHWQAAVRAADGVLELDPWQATPQRLLLRAAAKLAGDAAGRKHRGDALAAMQRPLQIAQVALRPDAPPKTAGRLLIVPRVYGVLREVYQRLGERDEASRWHERMSSAWKEVAALPGFTAEDRQEMERAIAAGPARQ